MLDVFYVRMDFVNVTATLDVITKLHMSAVKMNVLPARKY